MQGKNDPEKKEHVSIEVFTSFFGLSLNAIPVGRSTVGQFHKPLRLLNDFFANGTNQEVWHMFPFPSYHGRFW